MPSCAGENNVSYFLCIKKIPGYFSGLPLGGPMYRTFATLVTILGFVSGFAVSLWIASSMALLRYPFPIWTIIPFAIIHILIWIYLIFKNLWIELARAN
jgi:hypothetical protein